MRQSEYGAAEFAAEFGVSRETQARLETFAGLLTEWRRRINLVSAASLPNVWRRHIADSAQLLDALADARLSAERPLLDLGSGAGFPGLVLAILGVGPVWLIESDARKCAFLAEAAHQTAAPVRVVRSRIETLKPVAAGAVTARALAPLPKLLGLAAPHMRAGAIGLFPKGQDVESELTEATKYWMMTVERIPSRTDPSGMILKVRGVKRVPGDNRR